MIFILSKSWEYLMPAGASAKIAMTTRWMVKIIFLTYLSLIQRVKRLSYVCKNLVDFTGACNSMIFALVQVKIA